VKRLIVAGLAGAAIATLAAVTLGEYPLTGTVPWLSCAIVPALIGTCMSWIAGTHRRAIWLATGPLAAASLAWGVNIATSWGIDPIPAAGWAEIFIGLAWPLAWALVGEQETSGVGGRREPVPREPVQRGSADGQFGDAALVGRAEVGDPEQDPL